jgi:hypothetical protein
MLYSILSQINKGLRRIDVLRKSEIGISLQEIEQKFREEHSRFPALRQSSTGNIPVMSRQGNKGFFHRCGVITPKNQKSRTEREYEGL